METPTPRNVLERIVHAREAVQDGDNEYADHLLQDLEADVHRLVDAGERFTRGNITVAAPSRRPASTL
jgi:hypothetical protein